MSSSEDVRIRQSMALTEANNHLAINLHKLLAEGKGNVFFSPFSISTAMAMLLCAAEGETADEIRVALGHDSAKLQKEDAAAVFEQYLSILSKKQESYTFACANLMMSQKNLRVKDQYKSILSDCFKALLMEVDFDEKNQVLNQINEWVSEKTNKMIPKFLDKLSPGIVAVLLNAVYFKGSWLHKFDEKTTFAEKFYNKGSEKNSKKVDMMHMKDEKFLFIENESLQALQMPYIGEEVAMLILLPRKKDGLAALESSLTPRFIQDLKQSMQKRKIKVTLPKFKLEYSKRLIPSFQRLGVRRVFVPGGAELGNGFAASGLFVSEILHKAVLVVNEEGSEASATTMIEISRCLPPAGPVFIADHPFAFVIYDIRSDLIVFMGHVEEL